MFATLVSWLVSAVLLFVMQWVPFIDIYVGGNIINIIIVAVVLGLINAIIGPAVKGFFGKSNSLITLIVSLVVDAALLILIGWLPFIGFEIGIVGALIAAAVLAVLGTAISQFLTGKKK